MEYSKNLTTFTLDNLGINILYFPYTFSNAQQQGSLYIDTTAAYLS